MHSWSVGSAALAPVALIGGWTWAQSRQSTDYDAVRQTISALAAHGATDRWIMTAGLLVLGLCHLLTASGLSEAKPVGRALLALGGAATVAVAALPQPASGHVVVAGVAFIALALWAAFALVPSPRAAVLATVVLSALLGALVVELRDGDLLGLSERVLAGGEALWPFSVVVVLRRTARRVGTHTT